QGHAGPFAGPRGDLIVSTRVEDHPFFVRKGDNLHCEVPITLAEAILGARIQVPALDGDAVLVVPPGTQSGQSFRLRGRGLPHVFGAGAGDLYVTARVEIPKGLDARTQEIARLLRLTRDLGVNLAGAEIILKMRRRMLEMQRQIESLLEYVRDEGEAAARPRQERAPREALVRAATGQLRPVDIF